ncbi:MAG: hypothetical protein ACRESI_00380, partial [Gammaproteobacteria bacterium]
MIEHHTRNGPQCQDQQYGRQYFIDELHGECFMIGLDSYQSNQRCHSIDQSMSQNIANRMVQRHGYGYHPFPLDSRFLNLNQDRVSLLRLMAAWP